MDNPTALAALQSEKDLLEREAAALRQSLHELRQAGREHTLNSSRPRRAFVPYLFASSLRIKAWIWLATRSAFSSVSHSEESIRSMCAPSQWNMVVRS
jgi:hypothetical protein